MGRCCVIRGYVWALYEGVFREMSLYEELLEFQNDADVERAIQESENDGLEGGRPRRNVREKDDA